MVWLYLVRIGFEYEITFGFNRRDVAVWLDDRAIFLIDVVVSMAALVMGFPTERSKNGPSGGVISEASVLELLPSSSVFPTNIGGSPIWWIECCGKTGPALLVDQALVRWEGVTCREQAGVLAVTLAWRSRHSCQCGGSEIARGHGRF